MLSLDNLMIHCALVFLFLFVLRTYADFADVLVLLTAWIVVLVFDCFMYHLF